MKIKLEGTDGRIGTVKNTQKRNREDKITKMKTKSEALKRHRGKLQT